MNILNMLNNLNMLNTLNTLEVRYSRYSRSKILMVHNLNILENQRAAPVYAGTECLLLGTLPGRYAAGSIKTARFLAEFGAKSVTNVTVKVANNGLQGYDKNSYRNHRIQTTQKITNNRILQTINDLKPGQINSDNLSLVQRSPLIMPNMALLAG